MKQRDASCLAMQLGDSSILRCYTLYFLYGSDTFELVGSWKQWPLLKHNSCTILD